MASSHVRFWPLADISFCTACVCFRGQTGHAGLPNSTFAVAIGVIADMTYCAAYVCLWPKADIASQ